MPLINQPFNGQLGDILIDEISPRYKIMTIIVAFAKNSGVLRIKPKIEEFRKSGGIVRAYIGVDLNGTSIEALQNLMQICDAVHVIHSENPASTFHTKIFALENDNEIWMSVGSHNLTAGGLWTNFESSIHNKFNKSTLPLPQEVAVLNELIEKYDDSTYPCSKELISENDLQELKENGYIATELKLRLSYSKERTNNNTTERKIFGKQPITGLPRLDSNSAKQVNTKPTVSATYTINDSDHSERIWFETRSMTGGSRNILDLSKLGRVINGSALHSRYATSDENFMLGGVAFFDVDPEATATQKDITINYNGLDYFPCAIKFAENNGSWRIQIKGDNSQNVSIQQVNGSGWMMNKIVTFEKIRSDYYSFSVLETSERVNFEKESYVIAKNGSRKDSKVYGLLR